MGAPVLPEYLYEQGIGETLDAMQELAGVDGLWCGREWNEISPANATAFGNAVRDYQHRL